ncbi:MAG: 2-hydroxyacyl-CoA dehydratase [bacterium]|nr:2-hydroxyacyl-CoA dehydratase [bacterium]
MSQCGPKKEANLDPTDPCNPPASPCCASAKPAASACCSGGGAAADSECPQAYFANMIGHCLDYANEHKAAGKPVVGIMCEYTPRELIMAAGGVPVCLCGGSDATIADAERTLPSNLCPLIKSTFGYHVQKSNPFLEMADLIVAETTCDGKKKMYELMGETRPMYILELPQKADDADAFAHWEAELRKFKEELERKFGASVTDDGLRDAIKVMNRERRLRRELAATMKRDDPPLTGRELLEFKSSISGICADLAQYEKALALYANAEGGDDDRVRVLMTGVPMAHGAERVLDIVEDHGGLVVSLESCVGVKPIMEDVDEAAPDPLRAVAEKYFHLPCSVMTHNDRRLDLLRELAAEYRADCIVDLVWQACITYDVEAQRIKRLAEDELGLPYLRIETDYAPSDTARIAVRVEALFETVTAKKKELAATAK